MSSPSSFSVGLQWPLNSKRKVSTTEVGKSVWLAALIPISSDNAKILAAAIASEKNWRKNYIIHVHRFAELQAAASPVECLASCRAGLKCLNNSLIINGASASAAFTVKPDPTANFTTTTVTGTATPAAVFTLPPPVGHPLHPTPLTQATLAAQATAWAEYGCIEPSASEALKSVAGNEDVKGLVGGKIFVLLGATSALGPFNSLASLGATIACVARPGAKINRLVESAKSTAATLLLPTKDVNGEEKVGADMLADAPALAQWIISLDPTKQIVIGCYAYLDGEAHVRASVAMDLIASTVYAARKDTALAYLVSPATSHAASPASMDASMKRFNSGPMWHGLFSPIGSFAPNYAPKNANGIHVVNGLSGVQGPNYALAKMSQQWRAMVAKSEGVIVSACHAPAARTESMVSYATIAAALEGVQSFEPVVSFDADTASALMCGILLWDINDEKSAANPRNKDEHPVLLLVENACHGGMWGAAYTVDSVGVPSFIYGKVFGGYTPKGSLGA